jgi:3-deoxy-D-manno-octulosonic-acid transferase
MPWLLNVIYVAVIVAATPYLLYQRVRWGKYRTGWGEKLFGRVPELPPVGERVWFHAVSVGEVLLLKGLIAEYRRRRPQAEIVLTTTTVTGHDLAGKQYPDTIVCYCPLDFSWAVTRAIARLKPTALVLAELELWPNLILAASKANVRLAITNGRLSEKSFRGYRKLKPLVRRLLGKFDAIAIQNEEYAARFRALGAPDRIVVVTGSVKYDGVETDRCNPRTLELRRSFGIADDEIVFIAGSTQEPEEEIALAAWRKVCAESSAKLRLILVPRHKERFEEVARFVEGHGLPLLRRSHVTSEPRRSGSGPTRRSDTKRSLTVAAPTSQLSTPNSRPISLLDTLGELAACWGLADIAFVGGSLTNRGGQNMIEPAAYGAAVLFGPNTRNFRQSVDLLLSADAAKVVQNEAELTNAVRTLVADPAMRGAMGRRAQAAVAAHRGATERTLDVLIPALSPPVHRQQGSRAA